MTQYDGTKERYPPTAFSNQPARRYFSVTPSDTLDLTDPAGDNMPSYAKALYVGVTGDVTVIGAGEMTANPTPTKFSSVPVGFMPIQCRRVLATGTTASAIVALLD